MNRYWYHSISEKIDSFLDKAIFIKDTDNLFSNESLLKYYKDLNIEIFNFIVSHDFNKFICYSPLKGSVIVKLAPLFVFST